MTPSIIADLFNEFLILVDMKYSLADNSLIVSYNHKILLRYKKFL